MDMPPFKKTFSQSDLGIRCLNDIVYGRAIQQFLKNKSPIIYADDGFLCNDEICTARCCKRQ